jgi:hypothetical protein
MVAQFVLHCASSGKVVGSIPNGVVGVCYRLYPSSRTMVLGLTQPLNRNQYQEYFLEVTGGQYVGLMNLSTSRADCIEI